jgi:HAD superfamily phosphatase (TIGR01668 family)
MFRLVTPDLRVDRVEELTTSRLVDLRLESLLLDADSTLKPYSSDECTPEVMAWVGELRAGGIRLCLVSNGWGRRIGRFADRLGLPFVAGAMKPLPFGCLRAVRRIAADPARTAMVGDQVFADVMAGRLAGLRTILVRPIHPEEEPWFTRLKRRPEAFLLRKRST